MTKIMSTEIREELVVLNDKGEVCLTFFKNTNGEVTITDDTDPENMYAMYHSLNKEDWEDIKAFVDNQFND